MPTRSRVTARRGTRGFHHGLLAVAFAVPMSSLLAAHQAATPPPAPAQAPATLAPSPEAQVYLDAVRKGDVAAVDKALAAGVAVDTPFRYNRTALSFAADRGHADVVRLLLAKGANPEATDSFYNQSALGWAAQPAQTRKPEHAEVVRLLLAKGAKGAARAFGSAINASDARMVQVILDAGGLPPALLNESLAAAKKDNKTEIVVTLEKAGATMPVVVTLTPAQLARYPGTYNDGRTDAVMTLKDGVIVAAVGGGQAIPLSPRSETSFAVESILGLTVTFAVEGEQATSLTIVNQAGIPSVYKRVTR